jgi:AraC-like DNA-binding protein
MELSTTLSSFVPAMAEALRAGGVEPEEILKAAGVDPQAFADPNWRLPMSTAARIWELSAEATNDPCVGLRFAEHVRPIHLQALGMSWMASSSLADALHRLARYDQVVATRATITFDEKDHVGALRVVHVASGVPQFDVGIDAFAGGVVRISRHLLGASLNPMGVALSRPDIGHAERYREYFGCDVEFDASQTEITFSHTDLHRPLPTGNPELAAETDRMAQRTLDAVEIGPMTRQVQGLLADMLPAGEASQAQVARRLSISVSSLQRSLRAEGQTFRKLLESTRKTLAQRYIEAGTYTLSDVAYLLGFADQSSMSRAFRRWTGVAPSEYGA